MSAEILTRLDALGKSIETDQGALKERMDKLEADHRGRVERTAQTEPVKRNLIRNQDELSRRSLRLDMTPSDVRKYSPSRFIRAILMARSDEDVKRRAPYEWDVHNETLKANHEEVSRRAIEEGTHTRTMTTILDSTGGYLAPEIIASQFFPTFYANSVFDKVGTMQMTGLTSFPLKANRQTASTTAYRHGETVAATASDIAVGQIQLNPHKVSVFSKISLEDIKFTTPAMDQLVMQDQMIKLALKSDFDGFEGDGVGATPLGILNTTAATRTRINSGTATALLWSHFLDLEGALEDANALVDDGTLYFVGRPALFRKLRKTATATPYVYGPSGFRMPIPDRLGAPWPTVTTTQLSTNLSATTNGDYLVFGRFSQVIHGMWGGLEFKRSDVASDGTDHAFTQDLVFLKVSMWDDYAVAQQASVTYADDVQD